MSSKLIRRMFFSTLRIGVLASIIGAVCSPLSATNLYFSDANGANIGSGGFLGALLFNVPAYSFSHAQDLPGVHQYWSASANLVTGKLKAFSQASNNGTASGQAFTSVIAAMADTYTYTGSATGGQNITAGFDISGSWATSTTGDSTIDNYSYLRVYFLKPESLDHGLLAPANVLADVAWGIGPNAQQDPFNAPLPYVGFISNVTSTHVSFGVDIGSLPSGFQIVVLLQTIMGGDNHGEGTFSWTTDLAHTVSYSIDAPDGITLTSAAQSSVPEPATFGFAGLGAALILLRKYRVRRG